MHALPGVDGVPDRTTGAARQGSLAELTPLIDTTFVVVDLETTGLSPDRDRITEIGAVRARGGEVLAELRTFVQPEVPIPAGVTAITGITDADVAGAPTIAEALPVLLDFLGASVFVAHNAPFDLGFLVASARRLGLHPPRPVVLDTAVLARRLIRDEVRDLRLGTLARHLRAPAAPDHRALNDARATLHVLHALIERAGTSGATCLEDLLALCGPTGARTHRRIRLVQDAPSEPGVYRFVAADGTPLYIGKAGDLRRRLRSYFGQDTRRRIADLVAATDRVEWTTTPTELEAAVLELRALRSERPRYNVRSTRPDPGYRVTLTREAFPRLAITRGRPGAQTVALGPLTRSDAEDIVELLEDIFPLRPCRPRLRRTQDHPACVLKDLHRCAAPCDGTQTPAEYARIVAEVTAAMARPDLVLPDAQAHMTDQSAKGSFELAARQRDRLHALVRGYQAARRHAALAAVSVVLAREDADAVELVAIRDGRLHATLRTRPAQRDACARTLIAGLEDALAADPSPVDDLDRQETLLLERWWEQPQVIVLHAVGVFASVVAGSSMFAAASAQARGVERAMRGDDVVLARTKVRRRG